MNKKTSTPHKTAGIFIINLKRSTERRTSLEIEIEKIRNVPVSFFPAVDAKIPEQLQQWRDKDKSILTILWNGRRLSDNEIACYASHYLLWEKCVELNKPIVITEDDIKFENNFEEMLTKAEASGYDHIKFYCLSKKRLRPINENFSLATGNITGTQTYYITPKAAKAFIKNAVKWTEAVDIYQDQYWKHSIRTFVATPFYVTENELSKKSTLEHCTPPKKNWHKISKECIKIWYQICKIIWSIKYKIKQKKIS